VHENAVEEPEILARFDRDFALLTLAKSLAPKSDLPPVTVPVVKLLFAAPLGQPLHFVEA